MKLFIYLLTLLVPSLLWSQTYVMSNGSQTTCSGTFLDPGGFSNYGNSQTRTQTFFPASPGGKITIDFSVFSTESCCDQLTIYDGNNTGAPVIGTFRGSNSPGTVTSTAADGSLTFRFTSDGSVTSLGWVATLSCCITQGSPTVIASISNACPNETFQLSASSYCNNNATLQWEQSADSLTWTPIGGATASNFTTSQLTPTFYRVLVDTNGVLADSSNALFVNTDTTLMVGTLDAPTSPICSGESTGLSLTGANACNTFQWQQSTDSLTWTALGSSNIGQTTQTAQPTATTYYRVIASNGTQSDTSNVQQIVINCYLIGGSATATVCSGDFYDQGGVSGNYPSSQNVTQTFFPASPGGQLIVNFTSFNTESCCDELRIYDGNNTSAPLLGVFRGTNNPGQIISSAPDGSITFRFTSDGSVVASGWRAAFSCCTAPAPGPLTVSNTTACPGESFSFSMSSYCGDIQWQRSADNQTWTNIAGATNSSVSVTQNSDHYYRALLSLNGLIDSSASNLVTTDSTVMTGILSVNTTTACGGANFNLTLSNANPCNSFQWQVSTDSLTWTTFATNNNTSQAQAQNESSYYRVIATQNGQMDTSNVVVVLTDCYQINNLGPVTTCSGFFYDNGGASANYSNSQSRTQTYFPENATDRLTVDFSFLSTESCCDELRIYDGNSTGAPLIGVYRGTSNPGRITSTAADGSLTFRFTSDGSVVSSGWSASFSCCSVPTTGPVSASNTQICPNQTVTLDITGHCGDVQWQSSMDSLSWNNIGATSNSTNVSPANTTYYRVVLSLNGLTDTSAVVVVNVDTTANLGILSANASTVCTGQNFSLTLSSIDACSNIQWEVSTDNINWTLRSGSGSTLNLNQNEASYYRAIAVNSSNSDTSNVVFVDVDCYQMGAGNNITTCSGRYYDNGGASANYSNSQNTTQTFFPSNPTDKLTVDFSFLSTESCCDRLLIYDGNSTGAPLIGTYQGTNNPGVITSSAADGSLTFQFISDGSVVGSGWSASFSCCSASSAGTVSASSSSVCGGDPFTLTVTGQCGSIQWQSSTDSLNWSSISASIPSINQTQVVSTYYRAIVSLGSVSDTSNVLFVPTDCYEIGDLTTVSTCSGTFYDAGGASGNYSNNENIVQTFFPSNPTDKLGVSFNSFSTEACCDRLLIYNGPNTSAPLLGTFRGTSLPPSFTSTAADGSLTFQFISDGSNVSSGWSANFACCNVATGGTISTANSNVCAGDAFNLSAVGQCGSIQWQVSTDSVNWTDIGTNSPIITQSQLESSYYRAVVSLNSSTDTSNVIFVTSDCYELGDLTTATTCNAFLYDAGGASGNYSNNENIVQTFFPSNPSDKLGVSFNSFSTEACCDRLLIYNGPNTSAPLLGTFRGTNLPPSFTSTAADGSLTFQFISDGSNVSSGWSANLSCCSVANGGNITASASNVCAGAGFDLQIFGQCGTVQWQSSTDSMSWTDIGTNHPIITQSQLESSYYRAVVSLNGSADTSNVLFLTTDCYEIGDLTSASTCNAFFYDSEGANGNYNNNENRVQTFFPNNPTGRLNVTFTSFSTEACCDRLIVYNGPNTAAPILGTFQGTNLPPTLTSTATDGSLTFQFISDGSNTGSGWSANLSCDCDTSQTYTVTHPAVAPICASQGSISLSGGNPAGGIYAGPGISGNNIFDPAVAGAGLQTIQYSFTNGVGCTGDTSFTIQVLPTASTTVVDSFCQGGLYIYNGVAYAAAGTYMDTLTGPNGCDSIITLQLSTIALPQTIVNATICQGGLYTYNGITYAAAGTYLDTISGTIGCDTAVTLNLTVTPLPQATVNAGICQGGSFQYNGIVYAAAGTYQDTVAGTIGCDTVVTITITVDPLPQATVNATICPGEVYIYNGITYTSAGTYQDTVLASVGCDTVVTLNLNVDNFEQNTINASICQGDSYLYNGVVYTMTGTYTDTIAASVGCDTIVTLNLAVNPLPQPTITGLDSSYCDTANAVTPNLVPFGGQLSGAGVVGNIFDPAMAFLGANVLTYTYTDPQGCTNSTSTTVDVRACGVVGTVVLKETAVIQVYPNPTDGQLWVSSTGEPLETILVYSETGQVLQERRIQQQKVALDLSAYPAGVYLIRAITAQSTSVTKVILTKN